MAQIDTIYFIHHSHTDIGYTHDQPIVWDLHERFIDRAMDVSEQWSNSESDAAFRWTVETTAPLWRWLQHTTPAQIDRFLALEKAGRIEVTAMLANITPLYDTGQLIESFEIVKRLRRDYGISIKYAMNCDVNGQNWSLVDVLLDMGIEAFSMAVNPHYGGAPFQRPNAFWWEGASGRKLLTWNGWLYISGKRFGIGDDDFTQFETVWLPRVLQYLDEIDYPLSCLLLQSDHPFGDNGSAYAGFANFIEKWNAAGKTPRIKFATPSMWWEAVRTENIALPTYRGDWTDYWNFGCISSAREQAINRNNRHRLRTADALSAMLTDSDADVTRSMQRYRDTAWHHLNFWDEHTWGADQAIHLPYSEDTATQWHHKAHHAYQARSLSHLLQRDALAALARQVDYDDPDSFLVFNPLPRSRVIAGDVSPGTLSSRMLPWDDTAARHFQDRMLDVDGLSLVEAKNNDGLNINAQLKEIRVLKPVTVPGFGYRVVGNDGFASLEANITVETSKIVENHRYLLEFDTETGGLSRCYDKQLAKEWVNTDAPYHMGAFVYETLADKAHPHPRTLHYGEVWDATQVEFPDGWQPDWRAERETATEVVNHHAYHTPNGIYVIQMLKAPGCAKLLKQTVFLPNYADFIEFESRWQMTLQTYPEATYLYFPFELPGAKVRIDVGGQSVLVNEEQLPGVCRDYFTVQNWVAFNNGEYGMFIATPENPMAQPGDFHFGQRLRDFKLESATLLGWVTNNYWGTNFRAHQPGEVHARYRILPYAGGFNEVQAHHFGQDALYSRPLMQQMGEARTARRYPPEGTLLQLPGSNGKPSPILTLHVKRSDEGNHVLVRLLNTQDSDAQAEIGSALTIIISAEVRDLAGNLLAELAVNEGKISVQIPARRTITVRLKLSE